MDDSEFLTKLREYIETQEELTEWDRGSGKSVEEIIADGEMPDVYAEVLRRIEAGGERSDDDLIALFCECDDGAGTAAQLREFLRRVQRG